VAQFETKSGFQRTAPSAIGFEEFRLIGQGYMQTDIARDRPVFGWFIPAA
jgi:hypothetical protein